MATTKATGQVLSIKASALYSVNDAAFVTIHLEGHWRHLGCARFLSMSNFGHLSTVLEDMIDELSLLNGRPPRGDVSIRYSCQLQLRL
jgi:hypothetical protein